MLAVPSPITEPSRSGCLFPKPYKTLNPPLQSGTYHGSDPSIQEYTWKVQGLGFRIRFCNRFPENMILPYILRSAAVLPGANEAEGLEFRNLGFRVLNPKAWPSSGLCLQDLEALPSKTSHTYQFEHCPLKPCSFLTGYDTAKKALRELNLPFRASHHAGR